MQVKMSPSIIFTRHPSLARRGRDFRNYRNYRNLRDILGIANSRFRFFLMSTRPEHGTRFLRAAAFLK